jgi:hypothetical protein
MSEADFSVPDPHFDGTISRQVLATMWARIVARLGAGEVLITPDDFQQALGEEYRILTGEDLEGQTRGYIRQMVELVNARYPEKYVTQGVQNGVNKEFGEGVRALKWSEAKLQAQVRDRCDNSVVARASASCCRK